MHIGKNGKKLIFFIVNVLKDCSHCAIGTVIFIATYGWCGIQCKYSRGAVVTMTLNHTKLLYYEKKIPVVIVPCEQPFKEIPPSGRVSV